MIGALLLLALIWAVVAAILHAWWAGLIAAVAYAALRLYRGHQIQQKILREIREGARDAYTSVYRETPPEQWSP